MRILSGIVQSRFGVASRNLAPLLPLVRERMGLPNLITGTLNIELTDPYIVREDAQIEKDEYNGQEFLKLQRCRVRGLRCCIMRPNTHEEGNGDGAKVIEIMAETKLRDALELNDGDPLDVEIEGDCSWWQDAT